MNVQWVIIIAGACLLAAEALARLLIGPDSGGGGDWWDFDFSGLIRFVCYALGLLIAATISLVCVLIFGWGSES